MTRILTDSERERVQKMINDNEPIISIAKYLKINYKTAKRLMVQEFNDYKGNQSGKGTKKSRLTIESLNDYFNNKTKITSYKLKNKLFKFNIKSKTCESCGLTEWLNKPIALELHHVNGNPNDNTLSNLKILCPNCHAQSNNYRIRKKQ